MKFINIILVLFVFTSPLYPNPITNKVNNLASNIKIFADKTNHLTFKDIKSANFDKNFVKNANSDFTYHTPNLNIWLKFKIPSKTIDPNFNWVIEFGKYFISDLDILDVYFPISYNRFITLKKGFINNPKQEHTYSISHVINIPNNMVDNYIFVRVRNSTVFTEPIILSEFQNFSKKRLREILPFFLLSGLLIGMVLYNICLYFFLRDKSYLYYVLYILTTFLWQFFTLGYAKLVIPMPSSFYILLLYFFSKIGGIFSILFILSFLEIKIWIPKFVKIFYGILLCFVCSTILGFFKFYAIADIIDNIAVIALLTTVFPAIVIRYRQQFSPARIVLISWTIMIFFTGSYFLRSMNVIPNSLLSVYGILIGASIESVLLSMALAFKIRLLRKEKIQFQNLSEKDGLTNLQNKRFLLKTLPVIIDKALLEGYSVFALMIDVDNFKIFNDTHGHLQGDIMLKLLSSVLTENTRGRDLACRYGGEEFSVILNNISPQQASVIANRIIKSFSRQSITIDNKNISSTISIGLAELKPCDTKDSLLQRADDALYKAKEGGKNRVFSTIVSNL